MTNRHPEFFAGLAAVGAFFIAYGIASGIGFELWTSGRLVFGSGPLRLEPTLAVGAFFGAFVGFRLGGWRGALGAVLFALVGVVRVFQYPVSGLGLIARLDFFVAAALIAITAAVWDIRYARQQRLAAHLSSSRG